MKAWDQLPCRGKAQLLLEAGLFLTGYSYIIYGWALDNNSPPLI